MLHPHDTGRRLVVKGKTYEPGYSALEMTLANDPLWHPQSEPESPVKFIPRRAGKRVILSPVNPDPDLSRKIALESSES